ncbi:MAG: hypothetical protein RL007_985 [Bacteroidota bacterium]|jgi:hypothetical protein
MLCVFGAFSAVKAEYVWKSGYVILNSGDTVKGDIKYNTKKELQLFSKVTLKQGETTKNYKPDQIKEYGYEEVKFLTRTMDKELVFLKLVSAGKINLFEWQFEVYHGDEIQVEKDYYIENTAGSAKEPEKLKGNKFKKTVAEMMADHTELVSRVEADNKKYEIAEMQSVIEEYNEWAVQNNSSSANGTR